MSRDQAGLRNERLHSSDYFEALDLIRSGVIGANIGFILGVIAAAVLLASQAFGPDVPIVVYFIVAVFATLFGAWMGGLIGIDRDNRKLRRFRKDIEAGKYLILIYARKKYEETVRSMMGKKHGEAELVAVDRHFINPFSQVSRR